MQRSKKMSKDLPQESVQRVETRFGELEFQSGYPTDETAQKLYDELDFQRAVQAYLWAMPMASYGAMADGMKSIGLGPNTVNIADKSAEPQQLLLTANQDTIYMSGFLDLRDGPMVMEMPAGLLGTLTNIWQQPLTDLGGPFSPEQNRGGKFLILPPGYDGPLPAAHHHVVQSDTNIVVWYLRAIPKTRADFPKLVELCKTYRQYKLSDAKKTPEMKFILTSGLEIDWTMKNGLEYFEALARYINENPPRAQDMAMLGMLETLGIAHGKPFKPDARMKKTLTEAAEVGKAMAKTVAWRPRTPEEVLYVYPGKRHWKYLFVLQDPTFHTPDYLVIDQRTRFGFEAIGTANSMILRVPGKGSVYIGSYTDESGEWLGGEHTYKIHLPKDVPANLFWSLTAYDNETRSMIQNEIGRPLVGSVHGSKPNEDGSFDLYFGPELPRGVLEENWVQTKPGLGWFVYLRLYGPELAYFDKTWIPGDVERLG
jgi:hypothetical protein